MLLFNAMGTHDKNKKILSELSSDNQPKSLEKIKKKANNTRIIMIILSAILIATAITIIIVQRLVK